MSGIVIDRLVGCQQLRGCSQRFAAAGISGEAWMRAAGDLQEETVADAETVRGGPEIDDDAQGAIAFWRGPTGYDAQQGIADVD